MPVYLSVLAVGIGLKAHLNKPQLWRVQFESVADGLETLGIMLYGGNKHIFEVCLLKEVQIHVQYIMSIWKYLEPANRSMHAFFLSPLINLLPFLFWQASAKGTGFWFQLGCSFCLSVSTGIERVRHLHALLGICFGALA